MASWWVLLWSPSTAFANGIDLPTREASQGEEVTVAGHAWLTCCPSNTPVEHVKLFLCDGPCWKSPKQVLLFDVAANEEGVISTVFTVPYIEPGRYRLEACGGMPGQEACLPEGRFTVLIGPSPTPTSSPQEGVDEGVDDVWVLPTLLILGVGAVTALVLLRRRRPSSTSARSGPSDEEHQLP